MKTLPFLILILFLFLLTLLPNKIRSADTTVTVTIDEHLSFSQTSHELIVATNNPNGFLVLSSRGNGRFQIYGPSEEFFELASPVFIIVNI